MAQRRPRRRWAGRRLGGSVMRLSIVVPAYNNGDDLLECLAALQRRLPADAEILVVDDASTDDRPPGGRHRGPRPSSLAEWRPRRGWQRRRACRAGMHPPLRRCRRGGRSGRHRPCAGRLRRGPPAGRRLRLVRRPSTPPGRDLPISKPPSSLRSPTRELERFHILGGLRRGPPSRLRGDRWLRCRALPTTFDRGHRAGVPAARGRSSDPTR